MLSARKLIARQYAVTDRVLYPLNGVGDMTFGLLLSTTGIPL